MSELLRQSNTVATKNTGTKKREAAGINQGYKWINQRPTSQPGRRCECERENSRLPDETCTSNPEQQIGDSNPDICQHVSLEVRETVNDVERAGLGAGNKFVLQRRLAAAVIDDGEGVDSFVTDPLPISQEFLKCSDLPETQADG
jgi:hypothetical protein